MGSYVTCNSEYFVSCREIAPSRIALQFSDPTFVTNLFFLKTDNPEDTLFRNLRPVRSKICHPFWHLGLHSTGEKKSEADERGGKLCVQQRPQDCSRPPLQGQYLWTSKFKIKHPSNACIVHLVIIHERSIFSVAFEHTSRLESTLTLHLEDVGSHFGVAARFLADSEEQNCGKHGERQCGRSVL